MPTPHHGQGSRRPHHQGTLRPPQKRARRKVKHPPEATRAEGGDGRRPAREEADAVEGAPERERASRDDPRLERRMRGIGLEDDGQDREDAPPDGQLQVELRHLHARLRNVQLSLQTGQGLAHPPTWRTNCLLPVRNAAREWSAIVRYHHASADAAADALLRATAPRVFGLVQAALQTGPLAGSNPGYFKRCGGDAAALACEFLGDVLEAAGGAARGGATEEAPAEDGDGGRGPEAGAGPGSDDDGCGSEEDAASEGGDGAARGAPRGGTRPPPGLAPRFARDLQRHLLFSEAQAQRVCRWRRDAETARDRDRPPSASSKKLQGQRSRKQRQKELKAQRNTKKKKKGGEG